MRTIEKWREKCYSEVPIHLYRELKQFRARHPYKQITTNGHNWRYIVSNGGSESILMLCGATVTGESNWREFPRFSSNFRILSPSYPPVASAEMLIDGVRAILDSEGIERTHIIGASMGGAIAQWFIRRYPDRVGKLVLMSIGLSDGSATLQSMVRTMLRVPSLLLRRQFIREGAKLTSELPSDQAALMSAYFRDLYTNDINKRTIISHFRLVGEIASRIKSQGLDQPLNSDHPVLIINADDDVSFSLEAQKALFLDSYPNAREHRFKSGGHTLFGRREELYSTISDFLTG